MVVLIWPSQSELFDPWGYPPLGLLSIHTYLKAKGVESSILNLAGIKEEEYNIPEADIFGISITTPLYASAKKLVALLRAKYPESKIVIGGVHATVLPEQTYSDLKPDYLVSGDGEEALLRIALGKVPQGIVVGGNIDISNQPILDRSALKYPWVCTNTLHGAPEGKNSTTIITSRGCPFSCSFCCKYDKCKVRYRSPQQVFEELVQLKNVYNIEHVRFIDDVFTLDKNRLLKICELIKPLNITWTSITRADLVDAQMLVAMKEAGNTEMCFGVESGASKQLKKMRKNEKPEDMIRAIKLARDFGIKTKVFLLFGFPGENKETVYETMEFMRLAKPDKYTMSTFVPLPGSAVYDHPEKYNVKIVNKAWEEYWFYWDLGDKRGYFIEYPNADEIYRLRDELKKFLTAGEWRK
jgi:radical SAM superfamily enzyme YgiQ (UPF0313 family)